MRTATAGEEIYYPRWENKSLLVGALFLISIAECFRDGVVVRLIAFAAVIIFGGLSYLMLMNPFLMLTGHAYLKLTRDSLSFRYGKTKSTLKWAEIKSFKPVELQTTRKPVQVVGISFNDPNRKSILLPNTYGWQADELVPYLNGMKGRYAPAVE